VTRRRGKERKVAGLISLPAYHNLVRARFRKKREERRGRKEGFCPKLFSSAQRRPFLQLTGAAGGERRGGDQRNHCRGTEGIGCDLIPDLCRRGRKRHRAVLASRRKKGDSPVSGADRTEEGRKESLQSLSWL